MKEDCFKGPLQLTEKEKRFQGNYKTSSWAKRGKRTLNECSREGTPAKSNEETAGAGVEEKGNLRKKASTCKNYYGKKKKKSVQKTQPLRPRRYLRLEWVQIDGKKGGKGLSEDRQKQGWGYPRNGQNIEEKTRPLHEVLGSKKKWTADGIGVCGKVKGRLLNQKKASSKEMPRYRSYVRPKGQEVLVLSKPANTAPPT